MVALCCLFNKRKEYAYAIEKCNGQYVLELVSVNICDKCFSSKIERASYYNEFYQRIYCDSMSEVHSVSEANGIRLLGKLLSNY